MGCSRSWRCSATRPASGPATCTLFTWIDVGRFHVNIGLLLDPLSICFVLLITGVGSLIHIFAVGYMAEDPSAGGSSAT